MCNRGKFFIKLQETKQGVTLLVKEEVTPSAEVSENVKSLLEESKGVVHDELPEGLLSMRDISHHNDLISKASLFNFSHYRCIQRE